MANEWDVYFVFELQTKAVSTLKQCYINNIIMKITIIKQWDV